MSTKTRFTYLLIAGMMLVGVVFPMGFALAQDFPQTPGKVFIPVIVNRVTQDGGLTQAALQLVADRYHVLVSDLVVDAAEKAEYAYLGKITTAFKISNVVSGEAYGVELDEFAQEVDTAALLDADAQAYTAQYGKIEPALAEALAVAGDTAVPVIIALNGADDIVAARPDPDAVETDDAAFDAYRAEASAAQEAAVAAVTAPFVATLEGMGIQVTAASQLAYAFGSMQASQVEAVAQMPEVRAIGLDLQNSNDLSYIWGKVYYSTVYSRRVIGRGTKLAVNEVGHGVNTSNPYLLLMYNDATTRCTSASSHETGVAGIIYSSNTTYSGLAMGAQVGTFGSCAGSSSELLSAANRARSWGADAINMSWGATYPSLNISKTNEGYYDDLWRNTYTVIVKSAGNNGTRSGYVGYISNPAGAYNIITVGAENKTSPTTIASYSSWVNPNTNHDDVEKPEVTATGSDVYSTTTASPWTGNIGSGTSFSTPVVTALVGDITQRNYNLASWPEIVKAIAVATATRDITSGTSKDGAGGVNFTAADNVAARLYSNNYGGVNYTCSTGSPYTFANISVTAGKKVRAAIAWDTYSAYANYTTRPSADLDLRIYRLDTGAQIAWSIGYDRTYEWAEFTAPASTTYSLRIIKHDCLGSPNWLGWAYYRY